MHTKKEREKLNGDRLIELEPNLAKRLIEYHETFGENNQNILEDISNTLNKLSNNRYLKHIKDHSKFLIMMRALFEYNKNISKLSGIIKEKLTDMVLTYDLPENYELFLVTLSDFYRMLEDMSFSLKEIFWEIYNEYRIFQRMRGEERKEIYYEVVKDTKILYEEIKKEAEKIDEKNRRLIEELQKNQIEITDEDINELEEMLSLIKKILYKSKLMGRYIFRYNEKYDDEFSLGIKEAIRKALKSMM